MSLRCPWGGLGVIQTTLARTFARISCLFWYSHQHPEVGAKELLSRAVSIQGKTKHTFRGLVPRKWLPNDDLSSGLISSYWLRKLMLKMSSIHVGLLT